MRILSHSQPVAESNVSPEKPTRGSLEVQWFAQLGTEIVTEVAHRWLRRVHLAADQSS